MKSHYSHQGSIATIANMNPTFVEFYPQGPN